MKTTLAVLGSGSIAAGVALVYLPAGLITGGVLAVAGAWVWAYLQARRGVR